MWITEVTNAAEKKGIDLKKIKKICVSLDINGPLTSTDSAALVPYPGIAEAIRDLNKIGAFIMINTGWDLYTCEIFDRKRLGGVVDGIIGENGYVYTLAGSEPLLTIEIDTKKYVLELFKEALRACSAMGYSFADQGNLVNACYYHEFERGLTESISREGKHRPGVREFFDSLRKHDVDAKISGDSVEFDESGRNYTILQKVLTMEYKLLSVRPDISNGRVSIQIEGYKDKNIHLSELDILAKRVISDLGEWESYKVNDDFCIAYFLSKKILSKEINKATALELVVEKMCERTGSDRNDFLILGVDDRESDTCIGKIKNSLFFGLVGTEAEKNCDVAVPDGLTFLQLTKEIVKFFGIKNIIKL